MRGKSCEIKADATPNTRYSEPAGYRPHRASVAGQESELSSCAWTGIDVAPATFSELLTRSGAIGRRILAAAWSSTPMGPIVDWPEGLRQSVLTMLASGQPMALFYGRDLTMIFNAPFAPILGLRLDGAMARPLAQAMPDAYDAILPLVRRALGGETVWKEDMPLTISRNGFAEETWWTFSYSPVRDGEGRVAGFLDVVTETTGAVRARRALKAANAALEAEVERTREALAAREASERQQAVLQRELMHRMKNMLAIVQAVVLQSLRNAESVDAAKAVVVGRIGSFARAQDVCAGDLTRRADLAALAASALDAYRDRADRFVVEGPHVELDSRQATWIALALYELATNAVKYGALSTPAGAVSLSWTTDGERFALDWRETGGPAVTTPPRTGFGAQLTGSLIPSSLQGEAQLEWLREGLRYRLSAPLLRDGDASGAA